MTKITKEHRKCRMLISSGAQFFINLDPGTKSVFYSSGVRKPLEKHLTYSIWNKLQYFQVTMFHQSPKYIVRHFALLKKNDSYEN